MNSEQHENGRRQAISPIQKALLVQLVNYARQHKIDRTIVPVPAGPADYAIYVRQEPNMRIKGLDDLDALCAAQVLSYRFNRMGNGKIYVLTRESFEAAETWRQEPLRPPSTPAASYEEAFAETEGDRLQEALPALEAELRRRLPLDSPADVRQRIATVRELLRDPAPNRAQISYQLRRVARYLAENLHDRNSSEQLIAYSYWAQAIYRYLELRNRLGQ